MIICYILNMGVIMKKKVMFIIFMILMIGAIIIIILNKGELSTPSGLEIAIQIPQDYATIQEGIDASKDGDVIIVSPGTYVENINFNGKAVILGSLFYTTQDTSYISQTIIDGNKDDSVVRFDSGENSTSVLIGFTITNGQGGGYPDCAGGGITCKKSSSPSFENVTITGNSANDGGGIYCWGYSSPSLVNYISWNNSPQKVGFWYYSSDPNRITIAYSDIQGGEQGTVTNNNGTVNWLDGNIDADPLFVDAERGNYHLAEDSPCVDTGIAYFKYKGEVLIDLSKDEYIGIAPDMGANE